MATILCSALISSLNGKAHHGFPFKASKGDLPDIGIQLPANSFQLPRHDGPPC